MHYLETITFSFGSYKWNASKKIQRAVSSLPLSEGHLVKLASCGFERVDDLKGVGVVELSKGH